MKEDLKAYISAIKAENEKRHNFSILMHTISREEYSSKMQGFYSQEENVREMLNISNGCMFFDNESENKFSNFILEKD